MFTVYHSNRLEVLAQRLSSLITAPADDPLRPETVVVQHPAMGQWLAHWLALETGIAANIDFPLPASFIWSVFEQTLERVPELCLFEQEILTWRLLSLLRQLPGDILPGDLSAHLCEDTDGMRYFRLASIMAGLLDQYQVFRPEMLLAWEQQKEGAGNISGDAVWQAELWRRLTMEDNAHRARLFQRFFEAADRQALKTGSLPSRLFLFGIGHLAPIYLQVFTRLADFIDIHLFYLNPCREAWDDIVSQRRLSAIRLRGDRNVAAEGNDDYFTSGNPLLSSLGTSGRDFFRLLLDQEAAEETHFQEPGENNLLAAIQRDILRLHDRSGSPSPMPENDQSMSFHVCHSRLREIQILHDRLLDRFAADPELKPGDILVMAPDISAYAPLIAGVFDAADRECFIPWTIADRGLREENSVIDGFLRLLALPSSRCTSTEIMALLENPVVRKSFQLPQDAADVMLPWIESAGIRWGIDQQQRMAHGQDSGSMHTWSFGLDRLLLGHLTGPAELSVPDLPPCAGQLDEPAAWLGGLAEFIEQLRQLDLPLRRLHTPRQWHTLLVRLVSTFLAPGAEEAETGLQYLLEEIQYLDECCQAAQYDQPLTRSVILHWMKNRLEPAARTTPFLSGQVTFCNMVPMRSVPFKVIWILGMNLGDFPRRQHPPSFDLMAISPRPGDRNRRDDDRYLFLETLLSARSHLAISWVGMDARENCTLPPSVVVTELIDAIDRGWIPAPERGNTASRALFSFYPLQPFSLRNYQAPLHSYNRHWFAPPSPLREVSPFFATPLPERPELLEIDLAELIQFWKHPIRWLLENRLLLRLSGPGKVLPESELLVPGPLQRCLLGSRILERRLNRQDPEPLQRLVRAEGLLPPGGMGSVFWDTVLDDAVSVHERISSLTKEELPALEIDLVRGSIHLTGWLCHLHSHGRISYRTANCTPKDLLDLWLHHLVLNITRPSHLGLRSMHVARDRTVTLRPLPSEKAEKELKRFLDAFDDGARAPLHFYPFTSHAWMEKGKNEACRKWYSSSWSCGEESDPYYRLALRGQEPLDEAFEELADLFRSIIDHMEAENARA